MHLIEPDILAKRPDYNRRAAGRALPRWKWELLDLIDGERSIRALAEATGHDVEIVTAFADEMIAAEMVVPLTLSYGDFLKHRHDASPACRRGVAACARCDCCARDDTCSGCSRCAEEADVVARTRRGTQRARARNRPRRRC